MLRKVKRTARRRLRSLASRLRAASVACLMVCGHHTRLPCAMLCHDFPACLTCETGARDQGSSAAPTAARRLLMNCVVLHHLVLCEQDARVSILERMSQAAPQPQRRRARGRCILHERFKTLCPSGLRGWTQVPLARAAWVLIPQVSFQVSVTLSARPTSHRGLALLIESWGLQKKERVYARGAYARSRARTPIF